jgi:hypothetical protein
VRHGDKLARLGIGDWRFRRKGLHNLDRR